MLSAKTERSKRWEATRQQGRRRFILVYGVLGWGVPTGILFSLASWFFDPNLNVMVAAPLAMIVFPIGGILWGRWMWHVGERAYLASQAQPAP
ncbi:MAG: hypothetical protein ACREC6_01235 [Hyphomicrobiaceae bacterium]